MHTLESNRKAHPDSEGIEKAQHRKLQKMRMPENDNKTMNIHICNYHIKNT